MHFKQLLTCFLLPLLLHGSHGYEYAAHSHPSTTASHRQQPHQMMMDESSLVFFTLDHLKLAHALPIYFRSNPSSHSPRFLPRHQADSIPFSLSKLPFLLHYFRFSLHSSQATAMESTLRECTSVKPIKGETKFCATSLESMLDFVQQMLGGSSVQPQVLNTQNLDKSGFNVLKNYTIVEEPRQVEAEKMVACHTMPYPYVIYYCHYQTSESKVFQVRLRSSSSDDDEEGGIVEAVAVCHMDTSQWSPSHISFQVLGIKPGESPVCHFFPPDNLVWLPLSSSSMKTEM